MIQKILPIISTPQHQRNMHEKFKKIQSISTDFYRFMDYDFMKYIANICGRILEVADFNQELNLNIFIKLLSFPIFQHKN